MKPTFQVVVWRRPDAVRLLGTRALVSAVTSLVLVTVLLRLHDLGHGPASTTTLLVALALPTVVLAAPAGALADRHDSRRMAVVATVVQLVGAAVLLASGSLVATVLGAVLVEAGGVLVAPVWSALSPQVAGEAGVQRLASAQMVVTGVVAPLGGGLAGVLVQVGGTRVSYAVSAALLAAAGVLALRVQARRGGRASMPAGRTGDEPACGAALGGDDDWRAGVRLLRADPVLWPVLCLLGPLCLVVNGVGVLEVFLVRDVLGAGPSALGLGELAFGAGGVLGGLLVGRLASERARAWTTAGGLGVAVTCVGVLGLVGAVPSYVVVVALLGIGNACGQGALGPLVLLRTPPEVRGRVQGAVSGAAGLGLVGAYPLGGLLGVTLGVRESFVACGAAGLAAVAVLGVALWRARAHLA